MVSGGVPIFDWRQGDVEDDTASTKKRSLLAIAGSPLVEISLPKLLFAWTVSLLLPDSWEGDIPSDRLVLPEGTGAGKSGQMARWAIH
jgi:hypothetical protein